jgi:hypothetical protein
LYPILSLLFTVADDIAPLLALITDASNGDDAAEAVMAGIAPPIIAEVSTAAIPLNVFFIKFLSLKKLMQSYNIT